MHLPLSTRGPFAEMDLNLAIKNADKQDTQDKQDNGNWHYQVLSCKGGYNVT